MANSHASWSTAGAAVVTLLLLLLAQAMPASASVLMVDDLVHTSATNYARLVLAHASECWRQGMRSLIVLNNQSNVNLTEIHYRNKTNGNTYHHAPDVRGFRMPGDYRFAAAPLHAHAEYNGTYKWLLVGDDDTVFFVPALLKLLQKFDHNLPYVISDQFWNAREKRGGMSLRAVRPSKLAPRCLPCHLQSEQGLDTSRCVMDFHYGCPCTPQLACTTIQDPVLSTKTLPWQQDHCVQQQTFRWHLYGGAGAILSAGLMEQLAARETEFRECLLSQRGDFGDKALGWCLFRMGFAPTDPGPYALGESRLPLLDPFGSGNGGISGRDLRAKLQLLHTPPNAGWGGDGNSAPGAPAGHGSGDDSGDGGGSDGSGGGNGLRSEGGSSGTRSSSNGGMRGSLTAANSSSSSGASMGGVGREWLVENRSSSSIASGISSTAGGVAGGRTRMLLAKQLTAGEAALLQRMLSWHTKVRHHFRDMKEGAADICHTMTVYRRMV